MAKKRGGEFRIILNLKYNSLFADSKSSIGGEVYTKQQGLWDVCQKRLEKP